MFKWVKKLVDLFAGEVEKPADTQLTFTVEEPAPVERSVILPPAYFPQAKEVVEEVSVPKVVPDSPLVIGSPVEDVFVREEFHEPEPIVVEEKPRTFTVEEPEEIEALPGETQTAKILALARYNPSCVSLRKNLIGDIRTTYVMWQDNIVPAHICEAMVEPLPVDAFYVVLFAPEFVETLIHKHHVVPENIIFFGDDDGLNGAVKRLYGVHKGGILNKDMSTLVRILTEGIKNMKFDKLVVVGNPPYQETMKEDTSTPPLYNKFISTVVEKLKPSLFTFIVPSQWVGTNVRLRQLRNMMFSSPHLSNIVHFPQGEKVFETVSISGGVMYFLWDTSREKHNCKITIGEDSDNFDLRLYQDAGITLDFIQQRIIRKVQEGHSEKYLGYGYTAQTPFGIYTTFSDWKREDGNVPCLVRGREIKYVDPSVVNHRHGITDKWKVCISKANGAAQSEDPLGAKSVITYIEVLPPGTVCTQTYLVVYACNSREEAEYFSIYAKTRFFRFLLGSKVLTQNMSIQSFANIPELMYVHGWTDDELCDKFALSDDERAYIEAKIKPLV